MPSKEEIFSKVQEALVDALGVEEDEVTPEATPEATPEVTVRDIPEGPPLPLPFNLLLGSFLGTELNTADDIVIHCKSGIRSAKATDFLMKAGFRKVKNLKGGILAWSDQVEPSVPKY